MRKSQNISKKMSQRKKEDPEEGSLRGDDGQKKKEISLTQERAKIVARRAEALAPSHSLV